MKIIFILLLWINILPMPTNEWFILDGGRKQKQNVFSNLLPGQHAVMIIKSNKKTEIITFSTFQTFTIEIVQKGPDEMLYLKNGSHTSYLFFQHPHK
jgi:hypothetical protein